VRFLRWVHGALFREVHVHYVLLADFAVDGTDLTADHESVLDEVASAFLDAESRRLESSRSWYEFPVPYVVGHSDGFELLDQDWHPEVLNSVKARYRASRLGLPVEDAATLAAVDEETHLGPFVSRYGIFMRSTPGGEFGFGLIRGGASQTGPEPHNVELSDLRGHAVAAYLIQNHGIDAQRFEGVHAPGSSETLLDAVTEQLENREQEINRNARFICTYSFDLLLLLKESDLHKNLRGLLRRLVDNGLDSDKHVEDAMGRYLLGQHAKRMAFESDSLDRLRSSWPEPSVDPNLLLPMARIFAGDPDDDQPLSPAHRYAKAEDSRRKLIMAQQREADTNGMLRRWETTIELIRRDRDLAHSHGLSRVERDEYKELAPEQFISLPFPGIIDDLMLGQHFDRVDPDYYWLSREEAAEAETQVREIVGRDMDFPWLLPR
jgi:hypothetical protein